MFLGLILMGISIIIIGPVINFYLDKMTIYFQAGVSDKYGADSGLLFSFISIFFASSAIYKAIKLEAIKKLSRLEFTFLTLNLISFLQLPIVIFASTISYRLSYYSIMIAILSFAIIEKYIENKSMFFKRISLSTSFIFLILILFAPTLENFRSMLSI